VRPRAWARLDALQLTLLNAAIDGDVKAAAAILRIVRARSPPMGLNLRGMASGSNPGPRGQWSGIHHGDLKVPHALGCMPQPTRPDSGRQTTQFDLSPVAWPITFRCIACGSACDVAGSPADGAPRPRPV
jgi:hypothetical protein